MANTLTLSTPAAGGRPPNVTAPPPVVPRSPVPAPARPRGSRRFLYLLLTALVLTGGAFAFQWLNRPVAEVYRVGRGTAVSAVYGTVNISPQAAMTYYAQSTGYIHIDPNLGQGGVKAQGLAIKNGQLLGTIEDEPTARALATAKTEYQAAEAQANTVSATSRNLDAAREQLGRLRKAGGTISVAAISGQEAQVSQLEAQLANEKSEVGKRLEQARLNLDALEKQLKRSEIRSTLDGVLTATPPFDGALVFTNSPMFTVSTVTTYVSGQVNEEDVGGLKPEMKAEIRLYSYGDKEFSATLATILPSADTSNQRYTVILYLDRPPDNILSGMTGEMNIIIGKHPDALLIPARALRDRDPKLGDRVFVVDGGVVAQRMIKVGYRNPESVEVLEGLKEDDLVIVSDQDLRNAGDHVRTALVNAGGKAAKE